MLLYCIRHGESSYNAEGRIQGQSDVPLSELGRRQSEAVAAALAEVPIEAVYASPLRRAMQTARPVAERLNLEIQTDPRLMEVHAGEFQREGGEQQLAFQGPKPLEIHQPLDDRHAGAAEGRVSGVRRMRIRRIDRGAVQAD